MSLERDSKDTGGALGLHITSRKRLAIHLSSPKDGQHKSSRHAILSYNIFTRRFQHEGRTGVDDAEQRIYSAEREMLKK
jgi:hypothetical protein